MSALRRPSIIREGNAGDHLLRGLGRLDVFPMNDSSVARNLTLVARAMPFDVAATLEVLGAQRGMRYSHLLLARLEAHGEVGQASGLAALRERT